MRRTNIRRRRKTEEACKGMENAEEKAKRDTYPKINLPHKVHTHHRSRRWIRLSRNRLLKISKEAKIPHKSGKNKHFETISIEEKKPLLKINDREKESKNS